MKLSATSVLALATSALGNPVARSEGTQDVHVVLQVHKATSVAAIEVWNLEQTEIVAKSCFQSLDSSPFDGYAIKFDVDDIGYGTVTIGRETFAVGGDESAPNAAKCGRITSQTKVIVNCVIPAPTQLKLRALDKRDLEECFADGPLEVLSVMQGFESGATVSEDFDVTGDDVNTTTVALQAIAKRQGGCGQWWPSTRGVGNGNPHQNPLYIQLSERMECPGHIGCSITQSQTTSFTIGFSAQINPTVWTSIGFAVQQLIATGNAYTCNGAPRDVFATWRKQAQTAYTVINGITNTCTNAWQNVGGSFVMWSPNVNNRGGGFYCVYGAAYVRWLGDRWLDTTPVPGGPP